MQKMIICKDIEAGCLTGRKMITKIHERDSKNPHNMDKETVHKIVPILYRLTELTKLSYIFHLHWADDISSIGRGKQV